MTSILIRTISIFFSVLNIAILVRCILSWIPNSRNTMIGVLVIQLTEPILGPIRNMFNNSPIGGGSLDFSPIIAIILLQFVQNLIIGFII